MVRVEVSLACGNEGKLVGPVCIRRPRGGGQMMWKERRKVGRKGTPDGLWAGSLWYEICASAVWREAEKFG